MKDRTFKYKANKSIHPSRMQELERLSGGDECKLQFLIWADGTWMDAYFADDGIPIYRPAIYAWEAWKAAWNLKNPANETKRRKAQP